MTPSEQASLADLLHTPFINVLTYPKPSLRVARSRIEQLRRLGVTEIVFEGHARIGRLGILGIGTVGVVVVARTQSGEHALKIRRTDANRKDMSTEVKMAAMVNRIGIGPPVSAFSRDFILMKRLAYQDIDEWLRGVSGKGSRATVRSMIHAALNQCRKLDIMGIDHGQLSNLRKHLVIAEDKPWIIDFESAGNARRPRNVTSAAQYLFIGGRVSPRLRRAVGVRNTSGVVQLLTDYKRNPDDYYYSKLLEGLKLVSRSE